MARRSAGMPHMRNISCAPSRACQFGKGCTRVAVNAPHCLTVSCDKSFRDARSAVESAYTDVFRPAWPCFSTWGFGFASRKALRHGAFPHSRTRSKNAPPCYLPCYQGVGHQHDSRAIFHRAHCETIAYPALNLFLCVSPPLWFNFLFWRCSHSNVSARRESRRASR